MTALIPGLRRLLDSDRRLLVERFPFGAEDAHRLNVVEHAVTVDHRAQATFGHKASFGVSAQSGVVVHHHFQADADQVHLQEGVFERDAQRVGAIAAPALRRVDADDHRAAPRLPEDVGQHQETDQAAVVAPVDGEGIAGLVLGEVAPPFVVILAGIGVDQAAPQRPRVVHVVRPTGDDAQFVFLRAGEINQIAAQEFIAEKWGHGVRSYKSILVELCRGRRTTFSCLRLP